MKTKQQIIKDVLGDTLKQYGFAYTGFTHIGAGGVWSFTKSDNDVAQYVEIYKSRYAKDLRLELRTSVHSAIFAKDITPKEKYWHFLKYEGDQDFISILELFKDLLLDVGLEKLEEISVPEFHFSPSKEMYQDLAENHEKYVKQFKEKYNLHEDITFDEYFSLCESLRETDKKTLSEQTQKALLNRAAYYADLVIRIFGGEWQWNIYANKVEVVGVNGMAMNLGGNFDFLKTIMRSWEKSNIAIIEIELNKIRGDALTIKLYKVLYGDRKKLNEQFIQTNPNFNRLSLKECFDLAEKLVDNENLVIGDEKSHTQILEIAAFLSEKMLQVYDGKWVWFDKLKTCFVETPRSNGGLNTFDFLELVLDNIKKSDAISFEAKYKQIVSHLGLRD